MSIKKNICKIVGESILAKDLYEYKKNIKEELEQIYIDEINVLKESLCKKQKQIDELITMVKDDSKHYVENTDNKSIYDTVKKENAQIKSALENQPKPKDESRFPFYGNNKNQGWAVNSVNAVRQS